MKWAEEGMQMNSSSEQTAAEEWVNGLTHGLGFLLSLVGGYGLIRTAIEVASPWHVVAFSLYVASLAVLFGTSALYHATPRGALKNWLQSADHCAIYLLIAGSYAPVALVCLHGGWGWVLFAVVLGMAATGIGLKIFFPGKFHAIAISLYVVMGWLVLAVLWPLAHVLWPHGLIWLVAGGLAYTIGIAFYKWRSLPFSHGIWHVFVLAGGLCHFCLMFFYVMAVQVA